MWPIVPDADIVERVRGGDVQAYGALVDRYERAVLTAVLPLVGNRHAAEDAAQEILVQGYLRLGTLRDGARFGAWLMRIARREAVRASKSLRRAGATAIESSDAVAAGDHGPRLDEEKEHLLWHVHRLPLHEQLAVSLRYFQGYSVQEIADMTGRPVGTVTKCLSRAIARLRKSFDLAEKMPCQARNAYRIP